LNKVNVKVNKTWLTKALLKSIKKKKKKNLLCKRFLNNPSAQTELLYKSYKNNLKPSSRVAKRLYHGNKIEEAKSNIKSTWRLLNEVFNKKSSKQNLSSVFKSGKQELSDPGHIANQVWKYFTNICPSLANNIPVSQKVLSFFSFWTFCEFFIL